MEFAFSIIILIFSIVIHEVSHGYAALALGDKTAQSEGRLTLNPLKHLDPFGSVILPIISYMLGGFIFGWAKPVPYNPYNLRNAKRDPALVAVAGPLSNLGLALIFGLVIRLAPKMGGFLPATFLPNFLTISGTIILVNVILAVFNLVPIPPLDGSKILFALFPYRWRHIQNFLESYGMILLLIFIIFLFNLISPIILFLFRLITGFYPFL